MLINYYEILGIDKNANIDDIKKAYREKSKIWHPDKNKSEESNEMMRLIIEAKIILSDKEARERYNTELNKYEKHKVKENTNSSSYKYTISDIILNKWIANAKKQANEYLNQLIKDTVEISKDAIKGCFSGLLTGIVTIIGISLVGSLILLLFKNC